MTIHECSCGDTQINHAHDFPTLGCICLTCGLGDDVVYDEEICKNLKHIKNLIKDMKTRFDHVRGDVESREIMIATIERAIEIIQQKQGVGSNL